jgi:hypothetical protein
MLLRVYIDESGTDKGAPVLTVAGYVAKPSQWQTFSKEWTRVLKPTGIKVYHATDAQACRGEFEGWKKEEVAALASKLLPIIPKYAAGISINLNMRDFDAALEKRPELRSCFPDPYGACFHWMTLKLVELAKKHNGEARFALIHEQNSQQHEAQEAYDWIKDRRDTDGSLISLTFAKKDEFVPLQAADILAFEASKRIRDPSKPDRIPWTILNPVHKRTSCMYYDKSNMHRLIALLETVSEKMRNLNAVEEAAKQWLRISRRSQRR